jgi:predicted O-methyltransferase YrrM
LEIGTDYFEWALRLCDVVDNVVRKGALADATSEDEKVRGIQRFLKRAAAEPRISATAIQTVGAKGYDGFALALVSTDV